MSIFRYRANLPWGQNPRSAGWTTALKTDLAAFWPLSGSGADFHDGFDLTVVNSPGYVGGHVYTLAANLTQDPGPHYFEHADAAGLSLGDVDFAVTAWFYLDDVTGFKAVVNKGDVSVAYAGAEFLIEVVNDGIRFIVGNGSTAGIVNSTATLVTDTWHMVTGWQDATADTISIQVDDGTPDVAAWSGGSYDSAGPLNIAKWALFNGGYLAGLMSPVAYRIGSYWDASDRAAIWNGGYGLRY